MEIKNILRIKILIYLICNIICVDYYQRIAYLDYTNTKSLESSDYHTIEIIWSNSAIPDKAVTDTWNFYFNRKVGTGPIEEKIKSDNDINIRYKNYLIDESGLKTGKYYVAWNINPSCANNKIKVIFKIKFFICSEEAKAFYYSSATKKLVDKNDNINENKILVSSTNLILSSFVKYDIDNTDTTDNSVPISRLLGIGGNYDFIAICPTI